MEKVKIETVHRCYGPTIFRGDYQIILTQKKNHEPTKLLAHGAVHKCENCGWHFAYPNEGIYAEDHHVPI